MARELTKTKQPQTYVIEDKNGNLFTDSKAVLDRWSEYCKELHQHPNKVDETLIGTEK